MLLRGHGGTVANDLDTLLRLGLDLVRTARIQIMAASLRPVKTHSQEECEQMVKFTTGRTPIAVMSIGIF